MLGQAVPGNPAAVFDELAGGRHRHLGDLVPADQRRRDRRVFDHDRVVVTVVARVHVAGQFRAVGDGEGADRIRGPVREGDVHPGSGHVAGNRHHVVVAGPMTIRTL